MNESYKILSADTMGYMKPTAIKLTVFIFIFFPLLQIGTELNAYGE